MKTIHQIHHLFGLMALFALAALTSCINDEDNKQTVSYKYPSQSNCLCVTEDATGQFSLAPGIDMIIEYDLIGGTANISATGLQLPGANSRFDLILEDLAFGQEQNGMLYVDKKNYTSIAGGKHHEVSNFRLTQMMRTVYGSSSVCVYFTVKFTLDGKYDIQLLQLSKFIDGYTTVTPLEGGDAKTSTTTTYSYQIDTNDMTAAIGVYGLTVGSDFYHTLTFDKLPVTISAGRFHIGWDDNSSVKNLGGSGVVPKITGFNLSSSFSPSMQIGFIVGDEWRVDASLAAVPGSIVNN